MMERETGVGEREIGIGQRERERDIKKANNRYKYTAKY